MRIAKETRQLLTTLEDWWFLVKMKNSPLRKQGTKIAIIFHP